MSKSILTIEKVIKERGSREIIYVGVDGTGVPMRDGGTKEAKVGVIFKESDIWTTSKKRNEIVEKSYISTLGDVEQFMPLLFNEYEKLDVKKEFTVVCLGDGAKWIWKRYADIFPERIEILDFYHVSEYIWDIGREHFTSETEKELWVNKQLDDLKASKISFVIEELEFLSKITDKPKTKESLENTIKYIKNNESRMDYKNYISAGLMIGSGVVESSNRVVVTKRLKQGGMHWSKKGAEAIITLRALYTSQNTKWNDYWNKKVS